MIDNLWSLASELLEKTEIFILSDWNTTKTLQAMAALLSLATGSYGIYKAFRFAESRLANRLAEFLQREEERLADARHKLLSALSKPAVHRPHIHPVFANKFLNNALSQMRWGKKDRAESSLVDALQLIDEQVETAQQWQAAQKRQKAAAHLLLGALADSKGNYEKALAHFQSALDLNSEDLDAREYAGLQMLRTANAQQALEYFKELEAKARTIQNEPLIARSLKLQAEAYCELPTPRYANANQLLLQVVNGFLNTVSPFERALIHNQHGDVRRKLGFQNAALTSYQAAKNVLAVLKEQRMPDAKDARVAFETVSAKIVELNRNLQGEFDGLPPVSTDTPVPA
jgi:tetratricopeptide (TPR) repeat protein